MRKLCRSDWTGPLLARIFPKTQARLREAGPVVGLLTQAGPWLGIDQTTSEGDCWTAGGKNGTQTTRLTKLDHQFSSKG